MFISEFRFLRNNGGLDHPTQYFVFLIYLTVLTFVPLWGLKIVLKCKFVSSYIKIIFFKERLWFEELRVKNPMSAHNSETQTAKFQTFNKKLLISRCLILKLFISRNILNAKFLSTTWKLRLLKIWNKKYFQTGRVDFKTEKLILKHSYLANFKLWLLYMAILKTTRTDFSSKFWGF